jgi:hypothetical protein
LASYSVYPDQIDSTDQLPIAVDNVTPVKAEVVNRLRSAVLAIEAELGLQPSGIYGTVRARLDALENLGRSLGALDLAGVLGIGNATGSNTIIISSGGGLQNAAGTVTLGERLCVDSLCMQELAANPYSPVSGRGTIWLRDDNTLIYTDDTGADHDLISGAETLAATLALGNITGGTDIIVTNGDSILGSVATTTTSAGGNLLFVGGAGGSVSGDGGDIVLQGGFTNDGIGGGISIIGRAGAGVDKSGGGIDITAGNSTGTASGSDITLTPGTSVSGTDGYVVFSGWVNASGNRITNVATPVDSLDAVNKDYVDLALGAVGGEVSFRLSGAYSGITVPSYLDSPYAVIADKTLESVTLVRRTAGASGTTRVDIWKNGVSIFATDGNKPQLTAGAGDNAIDTVSTFISAAFTAGDYVEIIIDSAETYLAGPPEGPEGVTVILKYI